MTEHKNKFLIIGSDSYIAENYFHKYEYNYSETILFSYKSPNDLRKLNLFDPDLNLLDKVIDNNFKYALITSGITNLLICEKEKKYTYQCNVEGITKIAKFLSQRNITPIIFSSDYVYDGKEGGYNENSPINPLNQYGVQKAELEKKIIENCNDNFLLLRLSKIVSCKRDKTLLNQIIDDFLNKKVVQAAFDQVLCPLLIDDLLDIIMLFQEKKIKGVFNVCGIEAWNRYELSKNIIKKMKLNDSFLKKISLEDLKEPFIRPKNTSMNCDKFQSYIDFKFMSMETCIDTLIKNYNVLES